MKKIISFLMTLILLSGYGFSNCEDYLMGCPGGAINSLVSPGGFYVGLTGLYVAPSETGLGMFTDTWVYTNAEGGTTGLSKPSKIKYTGAGSVKFGYDFACTPNSVEVDYTYFRSSTHNLNTPDGAFSFGSAFFNLNTDPTAVSDSRLKYRLSQVDVTAGHRLIDASCRFQLRPLAGVRFINLHHDLPFAVGFVKSHYWGAGPMVGTDASYRLCKGLCLTGHFDSSILLGNVNASSGLFAFRYESPNQRRAVPTVSGRLGLAYHYIMCNRSSLKLELGYQTNVYFNPFDILTAWATPFGPLTPTSPNRISQIDSTNFAYSGPYLTLTWHM